MSLIGKHPIDDPDLKDRVTQAQEQQRRIIAEQKAKQQRLAEEETLRRESERQAAKAKAKAEVEAKAKAEEQAAREVEQKRAIAEQQTKQVRLAEEQAARDELSFLERFEDFLDYCAGTARAWENEGTVTIDDAECAKKTKELYLALPSAIDDRAWTERAIQVAKKLNVYIELASVVIRDKRGYAEHDFKTFRDNCAEHGVKVEGLINEARGILPKIASDEEMRFRERFQVFLEYCSGTARLCKHFDTDTMDARAKKTKELYLALPSAIDDRAWTERAIQVAGQINVDMLFTPLIIKLQKYLADHSKKNEEAEWKDQEQKYHDDCKAKAAELEILINEGRDILP